MTKNKSTNISILKGEWTTLQNHAEELLAHAKIRIEELLNSANGEIKRLLNKLKTDLNNIIDIKREYLPLLNNEELDSEVAALSILKTRLSDAISDVQESLNDATEQPKHENAIASNYNNAMPRLPKLSIAPFKGDPLNWTQFWDSFSSAIHEKINVATAR